MGAFVENADEDEGRVVELNVVALHDLTRLLLPRMVDRGVGAVLNVSSIYASAPVPHNATYAASKAFVSSFSEALHAELEGSGVSSTVCSPGPTRTEAFAAGGAEELLEAGVAALWQDPGPVAIHGVDAMQDGRRAVTPGATNRLAELGGRLAPRSVLLPLWKRFAP